MKDLFVAFVRTVLFIIVFSIYSSIIIGLAYLGITVYNTYNPQTIEWNGRFDDGKDSGIFR